MAVNPPAAYGVDLACWEDANAQFGTVTGLDLIAQSALHRITCSSVLGPGGEDGWRDVTTLLGMPTSQLQVMQVVYAATLQEDERILSASVIFAATTRNGLADVDMAITCTTALGPFDLVMSIADLTNAIITGQAAGSGAA